MPDKFTQVTHRSYGSRVKNSFGGVIIGLMLFIAAFPLLYWNEGRADISEAAATSTSIESTTINNAADGSFVSTTGTLTTEEKLGDEFLQEGSYVALQRTVEMYSWVQEVEESNTEEMGGSETVTTTYEYTKEWTEYPNDSSDFEYPDEHQNPNKEIDSLNKKAAAAKVGVYTINVEDIQLPDYSNLTLTEENTILAQEAKLSGQYLFIGQGNIDSPEVGDLRISYTALKPEIEVTAFGKLDGNTLKPYADEETSLYRLFKGTREQALATMHTEYVASLWILRIVGFFMLWIGMQMFISPLSTVLSFLPFLGQASRALISVVSFVVALVLALATIVISMILHSLIALLIILGALIIVIVVVVSLVFKKKNAKSAT